MLEAACLGGTVEEAAHDGEQLRLVEQKRVVAFVGDDLETVSAVNGGFVTLFVKLNDAVSKGQKIAVQRNGFGDVVQEYVAPAAGRVAIIGTDAATERGGEIATILVKRDSCASTECDFGGIVP